MLGFLSSASRRLGESLDYERTLLAVAELALPYLGSWCIVDLVEPDGTMRRLGIVHPDPDRREAAARLANSWPPKRDDPLGVPRVVRTRQSEVIPEVPDDMLVKVARSDENLRDLRALGIGSLVVVPLIARSNVLGAMTFVSSDVGHRYTEADLEMAEELAARAATAIDNARLFRDVEAARVEMEEARDRLVQMNERLVVASVRQQELAEEAREANRAKSQFLATMSHEIRTPINAIVGFTELLELELGESLTDRQRHYLARIHASTRHLITIIDDILDLAKVEAGRMRLRSETLPAVETAAAAVALLETQAREAGVRLENECTDPTILYRGDADRVRQILVILLNNALKFTDPDGPVTVRCGSRSEPDPDAEVRGDGPWTYLQVEDTGIGISKEDARLVFEPFVQSESGNTRQRGGAGLGLSIALELARRMGGDITLKSELGQGATFTVWLRSASPGGVEREGD